jgi:hypothetical protein
MHAALSLPLHVADALISMHAASSSMCLDERPTRCGAQSPNIRLDAEHSLLHMPGVTFTAVRLLISHDDKHITSTDGGPTTN